MQTCALCGSDIRAKGTLWLDADTGIQRVICSSCAAKIRSGLKTEHEYRFKRSSGVNLGVIVTVVSISVLVALIVLYFLR